MGITWPLPNQACPNEFVIVTVDYFTKSIEAESLAKFMDITFYAPIKRTFSIDSLSYKLW